VPTPALNGPHPLCLEQLGTRVTRRAAGAYLLSASLGGEIGARWVERSDYDVGARLRQYIGLYSHFAWAYASSPAHAYEMACEMYHEWRPPENIKHPDKPEGDDWMCPICGR
jgi:hypothetical protein